MWKLILLLLVSYSALGGTPCGESELASAISEGSISPISNCDPKTSKING